MVLVVKQRRYAEQCRRRRYLLIMAHLRSCGRDTKLQAQDGRCRHPHSSPDQLVLPSDHPL
jgi:hypothetical protein